VGALVGAASVAVADEDANPDDAKWESEIPDDAGAAQSGVFDSETWLEVFDAKWE
jgi:hypothetical protein